MSRKTAFFEGWPWFKFNNLGLALGMGLKFYTSVAKGLKLKVGKFCRLIPTFVEVTGENLVGGGAFATTSHLPPSWIGFLCFQYYVIFLFNWKFHISYIESWTYTFPFFLCKQSFLFDFFIFARYIFAYFNYFLDRDIYWPFFN